VILAHVTFCIPFALMPVRARLRGMPRDVEDAARDLYAGRWQVFRLVTLPLLRPAIIAGATLAFVVSLDDFLITLMVAPAGATTLPVYLYSMLRLGVTPEANAAATLLLAVSIAAVVVATALAKTRWEP
jgi:spermidine/putrescine transport system permease protein